MPPWKSCLIEPLFTHKNDDIFGTTGTLRSDEGDDNGNATKAIGLISKTTILDQFCTFITLFCTFLCHNCTTTTWKCLISWCPEEVHKRRRNFPSLSDLGYSSYEFNLRRVCLHLTKLLTWSNRDEDWKTANSLFQRRFLCRRRPLILRSLIYVTDQSCATSISKVERHRHIGQASCQTLELCGHLFGLLHVCYLHTCGDSLSKHFVKKSWP